MGERRESEEEESTDLELPDLVSDRSLPRRSVNSERESEYPS